MWWNGASPVITKVEMANIGKRVDSDNGWMMAFDVGSDWSLPRVPQVASYASPKLKFGNFLKKIQIFIKRFCQPFFFSYFDKFLPQKKTLL
jgi:hypothetical protein